MWLTSYSKLSDWLDVDAMADPDLVATYLAVHSAVYYWDTHKFNVLADRGDVKIITQKTNGR